MVRTVRTDGCVIGSKRGRELSCELCHSFFELRRRQLLACLQLIRRQAAKIRTRNNDVTDEFRMIPGEQQRNVRTVAMPNDIHGADLQCTYDSRRIVGHELVAQLPRAVRAVTVSSLIDADHLVLCRKVIALFGVCAVKRH